MASFSIDGLERFNDSHRNLDALSESYVQTFEVTQSIQAFEITKTVARAEFNAERAAILLANNKIPQLEAEQIS